MRAGASNAPVDLRPVRPDLPRLRPRWATAQWL